MSYVNPSIVRDKEREIEALLRVVAELEYRIKEYENKIFALETDLAGYKAQEDLMKVPF